MRPAAAGPAQDDLFAPRQAPDWDARLAAQKKRRDPDNIEGQASLFDAPTVTEPAAELVAEHKRLVGVLRSPRHADDKAEAKRQAAELRE